MNGLVIVGAGGHARALVDVARLRGISICGFVDADPPPTGEYLGYPVFGTDEKLSELYESGVERAVVGVGMNRGGTFRRQLSEMCRGIGFELVDLVHPSSCISEEAEVGAESQTLARAVINPGAGVGPGVIVNTGAIVEHDAEVGAYSHIATGAQLGGEVCVGAGTCIGLGASVLPGVTVGSEASVGAGAVVVDDVADGETVVGNPARSI
ncbi:MAG: acetyltransferase [Bradymonadaceae bacterium]